MPLHIGLVKRVFGPVEDFNNFATEKATDFFNCNKIRYKKVEGGSGTSHERAKPHFRAEPVRHSMGEAAVIWRNTTCPSLL